MKKKEIEKLFHESLKDELEVAMSYSDDPTFDKLYDICSTQDGYGLLFPVCNGWGTSNQPMPMLYFSQFYSHCKWCWDDDGNMCLILVEFEHTFTSKSFIKKIIQSDFFILNGFKEDITKEKVSQALKKHNPESEEVVSFIAINFTPKVVNFLHKWIMKWKKIYSEKRPDGSKYFETRNEQEEEIIQYIKENNKKENKEKNNDI